MTFLKFMAVAGPLAGVLNGYHYFRTGCVDFSQYTAEVCGESALPLLVLTSIFWLGFPVAHYFSSKKKF